jgi:geranylgeranyl diphosphate synthase type I
LGDEALIGKSASSDIETRKKTLPVLYGLENTAVLRDLYQQPLQTDNGAEFVQKVVSALDASGARTFAEEQARHYSSQAVHHLQAAEAENTAVLEALTDKLLIREH